MSNLRTQLRGTGVALVTPFDATGEIDFDALEKVIDSVITNGVEYVVTLGTTGETPTFRKKKKKNLSLLQLKKSTTASLLSLALVETIPASLSATSKRFR